MHRNTHLYLVLALAVIVAACATEPGEEDVRASLQALEAPPNVVLVTIDTLRADRLGSYGYERATTPNLDRFAREGVQFTNASTTVPFTLPAHSSIMTGTYPPWHGVRENVGYALGEETPTLAELLGERGWNTAGFISAFVLDSRWGIARGFSHYRDDFDLSEMEKANLGSVQRDGTDTVRAASEWLDERPPPGPFFLWVHLFEPHDPYEPPEPHRSRHRGRPYDGEVAHADEIFGQLRDALAGRDLLDSSLVIVTGDHGEGLGDHGEAYHGFFIYESTVHVPLLMRLPGGAGGGHVVDRAVSHVDLLPTVLEAVDAEVPEEAQGASLLSMLDGEPESDDGEGRAVYAESYYPLNHYGWAPLRSIRTDTWKYIQAPRPELYEIDGDSPEATNQAGQLAATGFELEQRLETLTAAIDFGDERERSAPDLDEASLRQLRALGYVAGRGGHAEEEPDAGRADPKDKIHVHQLIMAAQGDLGVDDYEAAERKLTQVLAEDPDLIDANQMMGSLLSERGEYDAAIEHFRRALAVDADHDASLFGLATAYREMGRIDEALVGYRRLLEMDPGDSKAVFATARILVDRNRLGEAVDLIQRALESREPPPILHNQLGELLVLQGRSRDAVPHFRSALEANDELAQPRFNLAVLAEERGEVREAIRLYREAIEHAPAHFQAQFNLGRLYGRLGEPDRLLEMYEAAIESNPDFAPGYFYLAKAIMDHGGDLTRAEQLAREGLERQQQPGPLGWYVLADILNRQGRAAEARQAAQRGRALEGS